MQTSMRNPSVFSAISISRRCYGRNSADQLVSSFQSSSLQLVTYFREENGLFMHLSMLSRRGGRQGIGRGFDRHSWPVGRAFDRFSCPRGRII